MSSSPLNSEVGANDSASNYQSIPESEHASEEVEIDIGDDLGGNNISSMEIGSPYEPPSGPMGGVQPSSGVTGPSSRFYMAVLVAMSAVAGGE